MVLSATDAAALTSNSITKDNAVDLQVELSLAEAKIRSAAGVGLQSIAYNATIIGNPSVYPETHTDLRPIQESFYLLFINAGFIVSLDAPTGYWSISWATSGAEAVVVVYSFRTTFDPTAIITNTISRIEYFFATLIPTATNTCTYNGFIDEALFGGSSSIFYEFTTVVDQGNNINHAPDLKTFLITQGLGYTDLNCNVYLLA